MGTLFKGTKGNDTLLGGSGNDTLLGDAGDDLLNGGLGADSLVGDDGNDSYYVDNVADVVDEVARSGGTDTVFATLNWTLGKNLENLVLLGAASLTATGNTLANVLRGNTGNNTLDGGLGADTLYGGAGNDVYIVDQDDTLVELANEGTDTVRSSISWTLGANFENLVLGVSAVDLTGTGNASKNKMTGNAGNNLLEGLGGNDTLLGGGGNDTLDGGSGADSLAGDAGNDSYYVDNVADVVSEVARSGGTDTVFAKLNWTLDQNLENLVLLGTASLTATGNTLANVLQGNAGHNTLTGGLGADTLYGGAGNDVYIVDQGDTLVEQANAGTDTVRSSISWTLGANFENLVLDSVNIAGTGNAGNNKITGNTSNNLLQGLGGNDTLLGGDGRDTLLGGTGNDLLDGGAGTDRLEGGEGDDRYYVDSFYDEVIETSSTGGIDTVFTSDGYTLGDNLENLTLLGSAAVSAQGNSLANVLYGNAGNNWLRGYSGDDTLLGGDGDDTLYSDEGNDSFSGGAGNDTFRTSQSSYWDPGSTGADTFDGGSGDDDMYFLMGTGDVNSDIYIGGTGDDTLFANYGGVAASTVHFTVDLRSAGIEHVTLTGGAGNDTFMGGAEGDSFDGNSGDDLLRGGDGDDTLHGGVGSDTLDGGNGDDYVYVNFYYVNANDNDFFIGGNGDDTLVADYGHSTKTFYDPGVNIDLSSASFEHVTVYGSDGRDTLIGGAAGDSLNGSPTGNDILLGGGGNDSLYGNDNDNTLDGGDGNDTLQAGSGCDSLSGGAGDDTLLTWDYSPLWHADRVGPDTIDGGTGNDSISARLGHGDTGSPVFIGGDGDDSLHVDCNWVTYPVGDFTIDLTGTDIEHVTIYGGGGNDKFTGGSEDDLLDGQHGNDVLLGGDGNDVLMGNYDNDTLDGGDGNDTLFGTKDGLGLFNDYGNDLLRGGNGNDSLCGGDGDDTIDGGAGSDTIVLDDDEGTDTVYTFTSGTDKLAISQGEWDLPIGDGDLVLDGAVSVAGAGGFAASAELVLVTGDISGDITTSKAATQIGSANSAYAVGDTRLFVVDNGSDSAVYYFESSGADATVSASELTLLATLSGTANTVVTDYVFSD